MFESVCFLFNIRIFIRLYLTTYLTAYLTKGKEKERLQILVNLCIYSSKI